MSAEEEPMPMDNYGEEMPMEDEHHMMDGEPYHEDDSAPSAASWGIFATINTFWPLFAWVSVG